MTVSSGGFEEAGRTNGTIEVDTGAESGDRAERGSTPTAVTMVLRVRAPVCGSRTTVIDRLGRLRATGAIEEFDIRTWPDEVALSEATDGDPVVETFERFERWAAAHDLSVRPAFDVRTVSSLIGREREVLTLPMMCLAVREGDDLVGVFPCRDGERTWTIDDCLNAYEGDDEALAGLERVVTP
ncbi:HTH domain-containing protein [Salinigranum sp. GCM10025319]|uniref:HTH domain-containing protein n=1 Tax=Salinigranum sp. GCM10025319 TaxID=3252687 RepID=UPI00360C4E4C